MRIVGFCMILALALQATEGRKCWFCQNARSNSECMKRGYLQQCKSNQHYCQNTIRAIASGKFFEVTKQCKQTKGCGNNERQNFTVGPRHQYQCLDKAAHSVCRCCCGWDNCNGPEIDCLQRPPNCPKPEKPINGHVVCSSYNYAVGTKCYYKCYGGYTMEGPAITECAILEGAAATWTNPPPECIQIPCEPHQVAPINGVVTCTDENNIGSVCTFTCDPGFVLMGSETSRCSHLSIWDNDAPVCVQVPCRTPMPFDPNRIETCTDEYNLKSTCSYACMEGYDLKGFNDIVCGFPIRAGFGQWNHPAPVCELGECTVLLDKDLFIDCTDDNKVGSVCTIQCKYKRGRYMERVDRSVVFSGFEKFECGLDREWTGDALPRCRPITCRPPMTGPEFGSVKCSRRNLFRSKCDFECGDEYDMVGPKDTICVEDDVIGDRVGTWNRKKPTCEIGKCKVLVATGMIIECTDENNVGSECSIQCDPSLGRYMTDYDGTVLLSGVKRTECAVNRQWTEGGLPRCAPITCEPPMTRPQFGSVSCDNRNIFQSTCDFQCGPGYDLDGALDTVCVEDDVIGDALGEWSRPKPTCNLGNCELLESDDLVIDCTNTNKVGSVCTIRCKPSRGRYMTDYDGSMLLTGVKRTECGLDREWTDGGLPTCDIITCRPPMTAPRFGTVECSNENIFQSQCDFECEAEYDMVGTKDTVCVEDATIGDRFGRWNRRRPTCQRGECRVLTEKNTQIDCTNDNKVGSVCTFVCDPEEGQYMLDADGNPVLTRSMEVECGVDRLWTADEPSCRPISCIPPMTDPDHGSTTCDNRNMFGSVCAFECEARYELVGSTSTTCEDDNDGDSVGEWSDPKPICEPRTCDNIVIEGATKECSNGNFIGTTCVFRCADRDFEYIGNREYTCEKEETDPTPEWDKEINGRCQRILCPSYPQPGENPREDVGAITCGPSSKQFGNRWGVGSVCNISCNPGFQVKDKIEETECVRRDSGTWSVNGICCVECTINVNLDVVVLLDSSEVIEGVDIWKNKADFLIGFTNYLWSFYEFNLNITFLAYGADVDEASRIDFMQIDSDHRAGNALRRQLYALSPTIGASNAGKALEYVSEELFDGWSEFRVPMIFLMTARRPSDYARALRASKEIRDRKIHLRIVPLVSEVEAFPGDNLEDFLDMVGGDLDAVVDEFNVEDLYDTTSNGMADATKILCNERTQDTQFCLFEDPFYF